MSAFLLIKRTFSGKILLIHTGAHTPPALAQKARKIKSQMNTHKTQTTSKETDFASAAARYVAAEKPAEAMYYQALTDDAASPLTEGKSRENG